MVTLRWSCFHRCLRPSSIFAAMSSQAAQLSYHYKSFCGDYEQVETALERLEASGYYWSTLSGTDAKKLLSDQPVGSFLIRDSSDHHHLFTLSIHTSAGIINLRIKLDGTSFYLETVAGAENPPTFPCVVKLVEHYMRLTASGESDSNLCYIEGKDQPIPLMLTQPLNSKVVSLQYLCKRTVVANMPSEASSCEENLEDLTVSKMLRNAFKN
ncbi:suppressor of cytokine signaling 3-like [Bombina bombina]|uniref:suppressor of cytokine signaling 3-like n=1 Tax=Bombina bombina TaxID=8345 RepID=UPI00235A7861|nr:suppressor of cytokine signaling 3-like [Bombina bombina]XP_053546712.1 suppressor of cytokine signaling 3-like [Bombina bombina]